MRREVTALEKGFSCIRSVAANKVARSQGGEGLAGSRELTCSDVFAPCCHSHIKGYGENEEGLGGSQQGRGWVLNMVT